MGFAGCLGYGAYGYVTGGFRVWRGVTLLYDYDQNPRPTGGEGCTTGDNLGRFFIGIIPGGSLFEMIAGAP